MSEVLSEVLKMNRNLHTFQSGADQNIILLTIFRIIKVCEGLPNLLRGFREGFIIKTA